MPLPTLARLTLLACFGVLSAASAPAATIVINPSDDGVIYNPNDVVTYHYVIASSTTQGNVEFSLAALGGQPIQTAVLTGEAHSVPFWSPTVRVYGYQSTDGKLTGADFNAGVFLGDWDVRELPARRGAPFDVTAFLKTVTTPYVGFSLRTDVIAPDVFSSLEYHS